MSEPLAKPREEARAKQYFCQTCAAPLCLRKQVINLALGNEQQMYCLICLANSNGTEAPQLLTRVRDYILGRQCFSREWLKYPTVSACPDPDGCLPDICFGEGDV